MLYTNIGEYPNCSLVSIELDHFVAVAIENFAARVSDDGVRLEWQVTTDEEIVGFNIYRWTHENNQRELVNVAGLIAPHQRTYVDAIAIGGRSYRYKLADDILPGGLKEFAWDGCDSSGNGVGSGVYFYRLETGNRAITKKMLLLK